MSSVKCVVEGCNLEYDVVCSFSFYNVNASTDNTQIRQEWIEGAMHEESECLWRHVSLQLCGYHFEMDNQGLWIDSPMLPELLTVREQSDSGLPADKDCGRIYEDAQRDSYQGLFEDFCSNRGPKDCRRALNRIQMEHNYSIATANKESEQTGASRLNVRQLVDTLGYLSLKNLQRKQLWVVKVDSDKNEASISQSEQVITKMSNAKQIIELIPPTADESTPSVSNIDSFTISDADNFIYEIAEEQEIAVEEVNEIAQPKEWAVNIVSEDTKPKYAYIKHCTSGKKKRHFTSKFNDVTLHSSDFENYYILPDADPSVGVEITTSYEPENYIVEEYEHMVLDSRPRKHSRESKELKEKKKRQRLSEKGQVKIIKTDEMTDDWSIENSIAFDEDDEEARKNSRVRRKNKKYLGMDFVT